MTSPSYERINYGLRPAKNIQRKMMADTFRRLGALRPIDKYSYVGFGSTYFSDFALFHRSLGIRKMLSIEQDKANEGRFEFNRPFSCITIRFGHSNEVLPTLDWKEPCIVWLDYDGALDQTVLADVRSVCASAAPDSVLVVSVLAQPIAHDQLGADKIDDYRLEQLTKGVGKEKVPGDVKGMQLAGWGTAEVYQRVIANEIAQTLNERNGLREKESQFAYRQIFHFRYADGAKMLTTGGLLHENRRTDDIAKCGFGDLTFVRDGAEAYLVEVPNLTYREIRHLDKQLPTEDATKLKGEAIPKKDVENYSRVYRYFPLFTEAEL